MLLLGKRWSRALAVWQRHCRMFCRLWMFSNLDSTAEDGHIYDGLRIRHTAIPRRASKLSVGVCGAARKGQQCNLDLSGLVAPV